MADITVKEKVYKINEDVDFYYVKQYNMIIDTYKENKGDRDEELLKIAMEAICPDMFKEMDFEKMELVGIRLSYREGKKLLIDLQNAMTDIINEDLKYLSEYMGVSTQPKNSQKVAPTA